MSKLSLGLAREFGKVHGMEQEILTIVSLSWAPRTSALRRAFVIELFQSRHLFDVFKEQHWPFGNSAQGKVMCERLRGLKRLYEAGLPPPTRTTHRMAENAAALTESESASPVAATATFVAASAELSERIIESVDCIVAAHDALSRDSVIRSQRFVGDFGEWIASQVLSMNICGNLTQRGYDLVSAGTTVQVKTNARGGRASRTILKDSTMEFDELAIVILTRTYRLRAMYRVSRADVGRLAAFSNGRRVLQWSRLEAFAIRTVPLALAPLLSTNSRLLAHD